MNGMALWFETTPESLRLFGKTLIALAEQTGR